MDEVGLSAVMMVICLLAGLFFSLISISAKIFSRVKIQEAFKDCKKEELTEKFVAEAEKIFWACSFLRIISGVAMVLMIFVLMRPFCGTMLLWLVSAFIIGSLLLIVFQIVIPYAWARYTGEFILSRTYGFLHFLTYILFPVLAVLKLHDLIVRRLAGIAETTAEEAQEEKQEEFLSVVEQGKAEGVVDAVEQEMIEHVLELNDTTAEEIMTPRTDIVAIMAEDDIEKVLEQVISEGHSRLPVYEGNIDSIIGLVYAKDLLSMIGKDFSEFNLRKCLRDAYFVPETKSLRQLLKEFQERKLHIAIVLDEYGGTAGIVTIEDILEEVVGEITDEYEQMPPDSLKRINETTVEIDARMYIDDLNEEFEIELPEEEDYDTVGGFVFSHLGYIPGKGHTFDYNGLRFTVTAAEARRIDRLKIQKISEKDTGS
ncbi:MAG: hemolysin family protein [Anaerohalosphaeraceae bacterium]|nr:hemolysin family protein [Anaerohalosphaeraceae bacterium]